jgi:hypothetical protein
MNGHDHFVKREGIGVGFLVAHPEGSDKSDDDLAPGVEKICSHLGNVLSQRQQPGPFGKGNPDSVLLQNIKDRVRQVCLGAELNVVTGIFRDLVEEFVQNQG